MEVDCVLGDPAGTTAGTGTVARRVRVTEAGDRARTWPTSSWQDLGPAAAAGCAARAKPGSAAQGAALGDSGGFVVSLCGELMVW
mmetsp:Transcript_35399/g.92573  ORF Transcript_35399/g.92573 Transcript_35399/m.92573 type:complete len:85 (+) Transcript_35399:217-471(+)